MNCDLHFTWCGISAIKCLSFLLHFGHVQILILRWGLDFQSGSEMAFGMFWNGIFGFSNRFVIDSGWT